MLLGTLIGTIVVPWTVILWGCPNAFRCLGNVPDGRSGPKQPVRHCLGHFHRVSCFCYLRIGIGLTIALLVGLAIPVGTLTTLVFKGSGLFQNAPALGSMPG